MPIAGRLYDKIGMRWLAAPGLALVAYGTWLLTDIGPDMTYADVVTWTCVRAAGMGLAMMPIMAGGIAVLPMSAVNQGSAWNNVSRQVVGALGLATLGALSTIQQSQLLAGRSAFINAETVMQYGIQPPTPAGGGNMPALLGVYQRLQLQVMGDAFADIFLVTAVLCAIGAVLALGLPARPATAAAAAAPPERPTAPAEAAKAPTGERDAVEQPRPRVTLGQGAGQIVR
jgi:hypothetical protein